MLSGTKRPGGMGRSVLKKLLSIRGVDFEQETNLSELYKQSIGIAWPAVVEGALLSIINSVDTMMVGTLGPAAIASVGLCGQPRMILMVFVQALCVGTTAVTARRKGAGDQKSANSCLAMSMLIVTGLGLLMALLGFTFAGGLLHFAGANEDTQQLSTNYFRIICLGFPLNCWLMCICAAMRAIGKTRITMVTNVTANLVNVCGNYCLIGGHFGFPALGVRGAAIATVFGTFVATCIGFVMVLKPGGYLKLRFARGTFEKTTLKSLLSVGSSSILESVFLRIGFFINQKLVAGLGTETMAAYQIISQVSGLSFTVGDGIAAAGTSLVGQSLGAKRKDLARAHVKISRRLSVFSSVVLMLLIFFLRRQLAELFTDEESVILGASAGFLAVAAGMIPQNGRIVYSGCLRGAGDVKFVALVSLISVAVFRPFATWLLCYPLQSVIPGLMLAFTGPWIAFIFDSFIREGLMGARLKKGKWAQIKL